MKAEQPVASRAGTLAAPHRTPTSGCGRSARLTTDSAIGTGRCRTERRHRTTVLRSLGRAPNGTSACSPPTRGRWTRAAARPHNAGTRGWICPAGRKPSGRDRFGSPIPRWRWARLDGWLLMRQRCALVAGPLCDPSTPITAARCAAIGTRAVTALPPSPASPWCRQSVRVATQVSEATSCRGCGEPRRSGGPRGWRRVPIPARSR